MGAVTGLLGVGGGAGGTSFGGPSMASTQGNDNMQQAFNMLQGVAAGTGPNPAQAQYNANVQNLAKQQAGAINSVQGISPALATRMASQQGSAAMQNAAAQGQANTAAQQLGAMGAMGNIGGMQQGAANQMQSNANNVNGALAQTTMTGQQGLLGGIMGGTGSALMAMADGGSVGAPVNYYDSPGVSVTASAPQQQAQTKSLLSQFLSGSAEAPLIGGGATALQQGLTKFGQGIGSVIKGKPVQENLGQGPTVANADALPSPYPNGGIMPSGNPIVPPYARGGRVNDFRSGGNVKAKTPAQKAVKKGNSYANDKIPALLSEGEVVIPRNVMQAQDPVRATADFVAKIIAKRRGKA